MTDDDLRAIFRYLRTVPPAIGGPDPSVDGAALVDRDRVQARADLTGSGVKK